MKEEIEALPVRCTNSRKNCEWEGQLRELDIHLLIYCPYTEIDCEHKCGIKFMRRDLSLHQCPIQPSPDPPIANGTSNSPSSVEGLSHRIIEIEKKQEEEMMVLKRELKKYHSVKEMGSGENNYLKLSFEVRALKRQLSECVQRERALEAKVKQQEEEMTILRETQNIFRQQFDSLVGEAEWWLPWK